ncbi:UDP-2,3-diacylglucosamine diphosphatase [Thalassoglobus sp. JC818]|uniref:UDP-2,3-diacylglucosamine diphosphatase n=1 Tax=Thalassoglobus sp. JC818 TaxID=3232136 RepID=UPI00345A332A
MRHDEVNLSRTDTSVRAMFLSDIHLGCRHSQAKKLLDFLSDYRPQYLYLIGDIIDGRSLRRKWRWAPELSEVLLRLMDLASQGTVIRYAVGNHDDFLRNQELRNQLSRFQMVEFAEEFVHQTIDEKKFLVIHGDRFDRIEQSAKWVSVVSSWVYEGLLTLNQAWSFLVNQQLFGEYSFSARVKRSVKSVVKYISEFEQKIADHAKKMGCEGVICGHIHTPVKTEIDGLTYCNTGDWVENCTALLEHHDGTLELKYGPSSRSEHLSTDIASTATQRPLVLRPRPVPSGTRAASTATQS